MFKKALLGLACIALSAAAAAQTVYVGHVAPMTGSAAPIGLSLLQGARVYFAKANAEGLLGGAHVEFEVRDDAFDPARTVAAVQSLIDEKAVVALLDVVGAPNNANLQTDGLLPRAQLSVVGAFTGSTSARALESPYLHFIRAGVADEARMIVDQLGAMGLRRIALLRANDLYGTDASTQMRGMLAERNLQLSEEAVYVASGADVAAAVGKLAQTQPQAIVIFGNPKAATEAIRTYRRNLGGSALIVVSSATSFESAVQLLGPDLALGVGLVQVVPPISRVGVPIVAEYLQATKRYGAKEAAPSSVGLEGYIAARVLGQALRAVGPNPTRERVTQQLQRMGEVDVGGLIVDVSTARASRHRYTELGLVGGDGRLIN